MTYNEFLNQVIEDGIEAARRDYAEARQASKLHGSVSGFEVCKGKSPEELAVLLLEAQESTAMSHKNGEDLDTYWFKRCYELEIGWVCNVVSALMSNEKLGWIIVSPTARGVVKASEILGVEF